MTINEIYECLHNCRYCDSFTGDSSTGCKGAPSWRCPCSGFKLDLCTAPSWAAEYVFLFEEDNDDQGNTCTAGFTLPCASGAYSKESTPEAHAWCVCNNRKEGSTK